MDRVPAAPNSIHHFVAGKKFNGFILFCIIVNAVLLGAQTYPQLGETYNSWFIILDMVFLGVFAMEILLKLYVHRFQYFRNGWNVFDFIVVFLSIALIHSHFVSVLRILRVLRVLRTISAVPSLRRLVTSLFMAIPTIGSVTLLMAILFYIYAVIGTTFYRDISPEYFGNLQLSFLTLFQVFTLESWASGVFRPIFAAAPASWIYFVSFILIATFIILNLIVGEIVNNATKISEEQQDDANDRNHEIETLRQEVLRNRTMLEEMKRLLTEDRTHR
jgi:Ion transport protein.